MKSPSNRQLRARTRRILWFGAWTIARVLWWEVVLRRLLGSQRVNRSRLQRYSQLAREFRDLAISMGGVLIKIGQFVSSRVDVLPREVTDELADLQDEVPPEHLGDIRAIIETELGQSLEQAFAWFDASVQAAASLGQTHRARLHSGEQVIVKVQRPGIALIVETDLAAVRTVLYWIRDYPPLRRRADVIRLLDEFSRTLYEELDYVREAENAIRLAENFAARPDVIVPRPYRRLCTRRILTLQDVEAIKITDCAALAAAGVDRKQVAARLLDVYLKQVFEDGFFHADPHPGNLFVHPVGDPAERPRPFKLAFVDFGMTGRVAPTVQTHLRQALVGLAMRDSHRIVRAASELGFFLPEADLPTIEQAVNQLLARFYGMSMDELRRLDLRELHAFFQQFQQLLFEMPIQLPQDYIYLGRTVGILSGLATSLDPDFNVWAAVQPYAEKLVSAEISGGLGDWLKPIGELFGVALRMPVTADRVLERALANNLVVRIALANEMRREFSALIVSINRLRQTILFATLLLGGIVLIINHLDVWGGALIGLAVVSALIGWLTER